MVYLTNPGNRSPEEMLREFHGTFGHHIEPSPRYPEDVNVHTLRVNLLREEYNEVLEAYAERDIEHLTKELADLVYVTYGMAVAFGIPLDEVVAAVHESNMSKLGDDGQPIYRESDRKVLKGPNYRPPDIGAILNGYKTRKQS